MRLPKSRVGGFRVGAKRLLRLEYTDDSPLRGGEEATAEEPAQRRGIPERPTKDGAAPDKDQILSTRRITDGNRHPSSPG